MQAFCSECGGYVELDENGECPSRHPRPCYRDLREGPSRVTSSEPTALPVPPAASFEPKRWVVPVVVGLVGFVVLGCVALGVAVPLFLRSVASRPYPPLPDRPPAYVPPSDQQKRWALAVSAVLTAQNDDRFDTLSGIDGMMNWRQAVPYRLRAGWGIESRADLLKTLTWLESGGHRRAFDREHPGTSGGKGIAAWDFGRYVALVRWGYALGYLTEDEAWRKVMPVAQATQNTYSSWSEFGDSYAAGREYWLGGEPDQVDARAISSKLLADPGSPWVTLPWGLDVGSDAAPK